MTEVSTTQDVLDAMTKGVYALKGNKEAKLTPTGLERPGIPEVPRVFLTNEAVRDIAVDLRRQAQMLLEVAAGLDEHTGIATDYVEGKGSTVEESRKDAERQADAKAFAAQFAAQQAAAQAATFTPAIAAAQAAADAGGGPAEVLSAAMAADGEAVCPTHGVGKTRKLLGGRTLRVCPTCKWVEGLHQPS